MSKEQLLIRALSDMVNAFVKAHGHKAIDCKEYPEYERALLILCRYEDTLPCEENLPSM